MKEYYNDKEYLSNINGVAKKIHQVGQGNLEGVDQLNKGNFGEVFLVMYDSNLLAKKSIKEHLEAAKNLEAARQLANEARILSELSHENIIELKGVGSDPESYFLLLDYLRGGTLHKLLKQWRDKKVKIPRLLKKWRKSDMYNRIEKAGAIGIARGLEYLHSKQIVFCDLKPENICYYDNPMDGSDAKSNVKLIDFGMARRGEVYNSNAFRGSLTYSAPQAMEGEISTKGDVFSFGVVLSEICSLSQPYRDKKFADEFKGLRSEEYFGKFRDKVMNEGVRPMNNLETIVPCSTMRDLVQQCWDVDPANRPTCADIVVKLNDILGPSKPTTTSQQATSRRPSPLQDLLWGKSPAVTQTFSNEDGN
jgi:serine/threonine protein kinase